MFQNSLLGKHFMNIQIMFIGHPLGEKLGVTAYSVGKSYLSYLIIVIIKIMR